MMHSCLPSPAAASAAAIVLLAGTDSAVLVAEAAAVP